MDRHEHVGYDAAMHPQPAETQTSPLYGIPALVAAYLAFLRRDVAGG